MIRDQNIIFIEILKQLMIENNITRPRLAKDLNTSYTTLSAWLQGVRYPKEENLKKIADYFNVSVAELIGEKPRPKEQDGNFRNSYNEHFVTHARNYIKHMNFFFQEISDEPSKTYGLFVNVCEPFYPNLIPDFEKENVSFLTRYELDSTFFVLGDRQIHILRMPVLVTVFGTESESDLELKPNSSLKITSYEIRIKGKAALQRFSFFVELAGTSKHLQETFGMQAVIDAYLKEDVENYLKQNFNYEPKL